MKKTLLSLCLMLSATYAYSFESGRYHGESADHQQVCDVTLTQKASSIVITGQRCVDLRIGMETSLDDQEFPFGHFEQNDSNSGVGIVADISDSIISFVLKSLTTSDSASEVTSVVGPGRIHYNLTASSDQGTQTFFDLDLIKQ